MIHLDHTSLHYTLDLRGWDLEVLLGIEPNTVHLLAHDRAHKHLDLQIAYQLDAPYTISATRMKRVAERALLEALHTVPLRRRE